MLSSKNTELFNPRHNQRKRRHRLIRKREGRIERLADAVAFVVGSKDANDRLVSMNAIADPHEHFQANTVIDLVGHYLPAAKLDYRQTKLLCVDGRHIAGTIDHNLMASTERG